ncbi:MAG: nitroreductase family protein [Sphingomonadaceae bacterium]|nr:nitroreductase family protein [Sphingomonadaceae bacterium]
MLNDRSTALSLLLTRRSGKPRDMVAPGPTPGQLATMLRVAARVPDHGKLSPWRFVTIAADRRAALADVLAAAYRLDRPEARERELDEVRAFAHQAPALVVVLSRVDPASKIPAWEQHLSAGAACGLLVAAASAAGFVAGWLTGWAAYSDAVVAALGAPGDRIAGFVFIGSPARALEERPRPDLSEVVSAW